MPDFAILLFYPKKPVYDGKPLKTAPKRSDF